MNASRMMTKMTTTNQKKNTTIAGIAYPPTVLALATAFSYPAPPGLSARALSLNPDFWGGDWSAGGVTVPR
jgi:hypothetical protein